MPTARVKLKFGSEHLRRARVLILLCKIASLQNFVVPNGRGEILRGVVVAGDASPVHIYRISRPERLLTISSRTRMHKNISAEWAYMVGSTPRRAAE